MFKKEYSLIFLWFISHKASTKIIDWSFWRFVFLAFWKNPRILMQDSLPSLMLIGVQNVVTLIMLFSFSVSCFLYILLTKPSVIVLCLLIMKFCKMLPFIGTWVFWATGSNSASLICRYERTCLLSLVSSFLKRIPRVSEFKLPFPSARIFKQTWILSLSFVLSQIWISV